MSALAVAVGLLAGCGGAGAGGGAGGRVQTPGASASGQAKAYRWLVRTAGSPPSIAAENRMPGTRAWRLPGPPQLLGGAARGAIAGYVSEQTVAAGQRESVYVRAPGAHTVRLEVYRMGWYGGTGGRLVLRSAALAAVAQPPCSHRDATGLTECNWHPALTFLVPEGLPSGVYIVKMHASTGAEGDCLFVLRPLRAPPLLVQIPTATYEAYNAWGGDSLYPGGTRQVGVTGTSQGVEVSYDRPYESQTGAGQFFIGDVAVVRFLERYGYPVGYTTQASIDGDPGQAQGPRALIDVGHSEYWSAGDRGAFERALSGGVSLIFLSSDTMAWRVRFEPASSASGQAGQSGHRIVAYKQLAALDPSRGERTGVFADGGAALVGSAYDGCITPRLAGSGPPTYRYYEWRASATLEPRWLFAHTGVTAGTSIPGIVGYELDMRTPATPPGTQLVGSGTGATCMPENEPTPAHGTIAETTLYTAPSGALVFATGALGWEYGLEPVPQASPDAPRSPDGRVVAMTRNLLGRAMAGGSAP